MNVLIHPAVQGDPTGVSTVAFLVSLEQPQEGDGAAWSGTASFES